MKQTIIAAMIAIITAFSMTSAAQAGGWKNGHKFKKFGHHFKYKKVFFKKKRCYRYKKLYFKTGNKFWLKKYKICRFH